MALWRKGRLSCSNLQISTSRTRLSVRFNMKSRMNHYSLLFIIFNVLVYSALRFRLCIVKSSIYINIWLVRDLKNKSRCKIEFCRILQIHIKIQNWAHLWKITVSCVLQKWKINFHQVNNMNLGNYVQILNAS